MALAGLASAAVLSACGLDADEETSTATTPPTITSGATGPSGPTGESGEQSTGAGLGTAQPEPAG